MPRKKRITFPVPEVVTIEKIVWDDHAELNSSAEEKFTLDIPRWVSFGAVIHDDDKQVVVLNSFRIEDFDDLYSADPGDITCTFILKSAIVSREKIGEISVGE